MNVEQFKTRYYAPIAECAHRKLDQCVVPDLPERAAFLKGLTHPLIKAALLMHMEDERYTFHWGQTQYTMYVSVEDQSGDVQMRLSVHLKDDEIERTKTTFKTDEMSIWMPGFHTLTDESPVEEQFEIVRLRGYEGTPFGDVRNALLAIEMFGEDDTIDIVHLGTRVGNSLRRCSMVTEYYSVDRGLWELSYRPVETHPDETLRIMNEVIFGELDDTVYQPVSVIPRRRVGQPQERTYLFKANDNDWQRIEEDAMVTIQQVRSVLFAPSELSTMAAIAARKLTRWHEQDDLMGHVVYALQQRPKACVIYDLRDVEGESHYVLTVTPTGEHIRPYEIRVRKDL